MKTLPEEIDDYITQRIQNTKREIKCWESRHEMEARDSLNYLEEKLVVYEHISVL